jgi:predicted CXXCH cytochrome family protein
MRYCAAFLAIGLGLTAALLLLCSCDEVERHRMLTVFFDGVPPLAGQGGGPELHSVTAADAAGNSQTGGWYVHKPLSNCTECHASRQRRTSSRQVQLVADVPKLCHGCHQEYAALEGWVHGPVAVGECLLCHEPHKARDEFLLVKPVPELCYDCHDLQAIRLIAGHADESHVRCTHCHDGHAGATKSLLRPVPLVRPAERASSSDVRGEREERQPASADRYYSSIKAYHAGQFAEARAGFLEVVESPSLPEAMREMAKDYLEKIEWVQKEPQLPAWRPAR